MRNEKKRERERERKRGRETMVGRDDTANVTRTEKRFEGVHETKGEEILPARGRKPKKENRKSRDIYHRGKCQHTMQQQQEQNPVGSG
jgi:hypothetical protein